MNFIAESIIDVLAPEIIKYLWPTSGFVVVVKQSSIDIECHLFNLNSIITVNLHDTSIVIEVETECDSLYDRSARLFNLCDPTVFDQIVTYVETIVLDIRTLISLFGAERRQRLSSSDLCLHTSDVLEVGPPEV